MIDYARDRTQEPEIRKHGATLLSTLLQGFLISLKLSGHACLAVIISPNAQSYGRNRPSLVERTGLSGGAQICTLTADQLALEEEECISNSIQKQRSSGKDNDYCLHSSKSTFGSYQYFLQFLPTVYKGD